jgi:hypothetical protein
MKILTFTRDGQKTPNVPLRDGLQLQHVVFESNKLEDLLLIAKYRVVNFPTSLVIDDTGRVLLKVKGSIPEYCLSGVMNTN